METHYYAHLFLALLLMGFTLPFLLPKKRYALTIPLHPYHKTLWRFIFCGTFPRVTSGGCYPSSRFQGARTFLSKMRAVVLLSGRYIINTFFNYVQVKIKYYSNIFFIEFQSKFSPGSFFLSGATSE